MYKILVADEDSQNVVIIRRIAEKIVRKIELAAHTATGGETIEKIKELQPDLLILDIKLAGINGIDVVRKIRSFDKKIHIIILTAYSYFELAKEFIGLTVDAYILKPIDTKELQRALSMVFQRIQGERKERELELKKERELAEGRKSAEYSLIYSLLFNDDYVNTLEPYVKLLGLEPEGYVLNIEMGYQFIQKTKNSDKMPLMLYECVKNTISKYHICAVGPCIANRLIVYVCDEKISDFEKQKQNILKICNLIIKNIKEQFNITSYIGAGGIYNIEQLHLSYEEAMKSLRYKRDDLKDRVHIADVEDKMVIVHDSYMELERLLIESVRTGQSDYMDYFTSMLDMLRVLSLEDRKNKIIELLIEVCHFARMEEPGEGGFLDYLSYIEELKDIHETDLDAFVYRKFQYLIRTLRTRRTTRVPYIIHSAIAYIEKHYTESISLEDIADHVGLTPQYFSTYFKEEMNCNLIDYIARLRIEKAKEIIRNSQMSVQEICFIVGYHDPNYFSRIFKKYVGVTPTKYKKEFGGV